MKNQKTPRMPRMFKTLLGKTAGGILGYCCVDGTGKIHSHLFPERHIVLNGSTMDIVNDDGNTVWAKMSLSDSAFRLLSLLTAEANDVERYVRGMSKTPEFVEYTKALTWIYDEWITYAGREVAIRSSDLIDSVQFSEVDAIISQHAKSGLINGKFKLTSEKYGFTECAWWFLDYKIGKFQLTVDGMVMNVNLETLVHVDQIIREITSDLNDGLSEGKIYNSNDSNLPHEVGYWSVDGYEDGYKSSDSLDESEKDDIIDEMSAFITQMVGGSSDDRKRMTIYNTMVKIGVWE